MTPQAGPQSATSAHPMSGYPSNHQSPMGGPSPSGRGYSSQPQSAYGGPGMHPPTYQVPGSAGIPPGSAGGYGRDQTSAGGYGAPPSAGGYPPSSIPSAGYGGSPSGGYQGY